jgi:hypothetical protein
MNQDHERVPRNHSRLTQVPRHSVHFRPDFPPPEAADMRIDRVEIIGWEVFVHNGEAASIFAPIVMWESTVLHGSSCARCSCCGTWLSYAGFIGHY